MSYCGSPAYMAPEILLDKGSSQESDYYGIGIVLYEMLIGEPPFNAETLNEMYTLIKKADPVIPPYVHEKTKNLLLVYFTS